MRAVRRLGPAPGAATDTNELCVEKYAGWLAGVVAPTERPMLQPPLPVGPPT